MSGRSVPEWRGATPDQAIPPRVKLRVFERFNGCCYVAKRKIRAGERWDVDHVIALTNGGENRESNLAPILLDKHREKTSADVAEKSAVYQKRCKHLGIREKGRGFRKHPTLKRTVSGRVVPRFSKTDEELASDSK